MQAGEGTWLPRLQGPGRPRQLRSSVSGQHLGKALARSVRRDPGIGTPRGGGRGPESASVHPGASATAAIVISSERRRCTGS